MKKRRLLFMLLLITGLFLSGCGEKEKGQTEGETDNKLTVYTTVYPLQFFTEQIGGKAVYVETIYPPGADEHTFDPSQKDMIKLAEADLFIYIGLGLEGFVDKAKAAINEENVTFLAAGEEIEFDDHENEAAETHAHDEHDHAHQEEEAHDHGHVHGDIDPHVWLDPIYSIQMAEAIKNELSEQLPDKADEFNKNYEELKEKLLDIDAQFTALSKEAKVKKILVSHAAYGYWEKRYGIEQISIAGLSTASEPSQKTLAKVIDTAKEHHLNYIFFEQNVSLRLAEAVQKELDAEAKVLHNLATLTDEDIKNKADYFSLMVGNIEVLKTALQ